MLFSGLFNPLLYCAMLFTTSPEVGHVAVR
jgi:hypothetical protein